MKIKLILISVVALSFILNSCGKGSIEDKLVGDWQQISVGQIPENTVVKWTFSADHRLFQTVTVNDTIIASIDTAEWSVEYNMATKNTVFIDNLSANADGTHLIHELDDYLSIQRVEFTNGHGDGSYMWFEFEKL